MATLVGTPVLTDGTFSTDKTATLPSGIQAGDVIFCAWVTANEHTISSLGDFTQLGTTETSSLESMSVAYKVATGSEGAGITFTGLFASAESGGTLAFAYRGLDTADLIEAVDQASLAVAGTAVSGPSITPANDGCLILQINGTDPGGPSMTPDAIATEVFDGQDSGAFSYYGVQAYEQPTAGAIALDATFSESLVYITFQVALNQSATGATGTATSTLPSTTQIATGVVGSAALDAALQYGAAFTGTYSGLSPSNPDDLVVSDGTRSMTVSTAVDTGAGTFGDTFTALPAAPGDLPAGSAVFPGSVTATFEGVDISTTLSVPTGYATFIVGADPDYTAFDASSWDEADRPVTGEAVIYDTRSGDVTMYDDLTLDAEIEDDDIYLAVIRADGSVDSGFIDTTGVPEVGSSGAATNTLPAMTQASQGDSSQTATVAQVIPLFTQSMSGFTGLGGVLAQTLPSLTQEMAGGIDTGGGISQTLPSFSQSADGTSAAVDDGSETETFNVVYRRRRRA